MPAPICGARVAAAGDVLVVVWTDSGRVISLNVERRIFRYLADLRRPHVGGATTVIGGRVYITGGGGAGSDAYVFVLLHSLLILLTMPHTSAGFKGGAGLPPTHTHPLSGTTRVSRYQKGKTNLDFAEARDSEWQWHQLDHMQVCTTLQTDIHASTPPVSFFYSPNALPAAQPTASKHRRQL